MKTLIVHYHSFELWHAPLWIRERLQQDFHGHTFVQLQNYDRVPEEIPDTDVFIGWSLRPEQFADAKKLRWIHSPAAAVHQLMYPEMVRSNVVVTNSTGIHGPVVAEHAIAVLLALAKRLPQAMQYQAKHEWSQDQLWHGQPRPREVADSTVLIIGMGGIGREFAARAKALGMKILAIRENPAKGLDGADAVYGSAADRRSSAPGRLCSALHSGHPSDHRTHERRSTGQNETRRLPDQRRPRAADR